MPCGVDRQDVGTNSIKCTCCVKSTRKKCAVVTGVAGGLQDVECRCQFLSLPSVCWKWGCGCSVLMLDMVEKLELVDKFCYLGDILGDIIISYIYN